MSLTRYITVAVCQHVFLSVILICVSFLMNGYMGKEKNNSLKVRVSQKSYQILASQNSKRS